MVCTVVTSVLPSNGVYTLALAFALLLFRCVYDLFSVTLCMPVTKSILCGLSSILGVPILRPVECVYHRVCMLIRMARSQFGVLMFLMRHLEVFLNFRASALKG